MVKFLIFIKHHFSFIWSFVEFINSMIFYILYGNIKKKAVDAILPNEYKGFEYRLLHENDIDGLVDFFKNQPESAYEYFKPHAFDAASLKRKLSDHSFIMMGVLSEGKIVGYFFLRCFFNRKAFRGKIVDRDFQGKGISKQMAVVTTGICEIMNFRQFETLSRDNIASLASTEAVNRVEIINELSDNYIFIECFPKD